MTAKNKGYNKSVIEDFRTEIQKEKKPFLIVDSDDNSDEYVNFRFLGMYEGKEVIYDAVMYTLQLHHLSEIYEIAEHKAAQHFPEFRKIKYEEDENGDLEALDNLEEEIGLFIAEAIMELEADDEVKVKEHVEIDSNIEFGVGLDIGLNVEQITNEVIGQFVKDYNDDQLNLDETMYSFQTQDEEMT